MKQKLLMMLTLALMLVLGGKNVCGQTTLYSQGFETDLTGYSNSPSQTPSTDPGDQYFYRAEPSDASIYEGSVGPYTNVTGSWLFVGSNPNTINSGNPGELTLSPISVVDYTDLEFYADFGACPNDWDTSDDLKVEYNFDGGSWSTLYSFEAGGDGTNEPIALAGNSSGGINTANGTILTYDLATISSDNFTGSGNILNIRIICDANANYEAFGVDNIIIKGVNSGGGNTHPVITNITHTPTLPNSSETVSVSADITDDGTLTDVTVNWGLTSGNLTNDIFMSPTGDTYVTVSDIPAQADGTTVYYEVYALDDADGSTTSPEQSYTVTNLSPEPSGHVTGFAAATITTNAIPLDWTDSDAAYYLIKAVETGGTITPPVDGTAEADDLLVKNIAAGVETVTFTGLASFTSYTFEIFPYNGTGTTVNYKTDGTVPSVVAATLGVQTTLPYTEDFESDLGDCSTYSVTGDSKNWYWNSTDKTASMNGYNTGETEEDWLILPQIDFSGYTDVIMTFDTWYNYGNDDANNYLKLVYSTDYTGSGDPSTATWNELSYNITDAWYTWTNSLLVDLTSITDPSVYIAYKYHYESGSYRYWQIDNIRVFEGSQVDVTFQVNMTDEASISENGIHIAGNFQGWDPAATEMLEGTTANVYEVTIPLYSDIEYQFKYINGNDWSSPAVVETVPAECQAPGTTNRFAIIGDANYSLDPVCFSSCTDCNFVPSYDVTFQVDMANAENVTDVYIAGTFNSWSTTANPMTLQAGSTTVYEITLPIEEASYIMYKFINGTSWEDNIGTECTNSGNRYYTVPAENSTIDLVCFNSCTACVQPYDITFQVNMMNEEVSVDGVHLVGSFTDWGTNAIALTQSGTIWSTTVAIMGNEYIEYKFSNGDPTNGENYESFEGTCLVGGAGTNRYYNVPLENTTMDLVCFNSCDACPISELFFSEVSDPKDAYESRFVELYNASDITIDFDTDTWYIVKQVNGSSQYSFQLTGTVVSGGVFVVSGNAASFNTSYSFDANQNNSQVSGNGDDGYFLYYGGDHTTGTLVDAYGVIDEDGSGKAWEYTDTKAVRLRSVSSPNATWTASEWSIPAQANVADMTPSEHKADVIWQGTTDNDWNTKGDNWSGTYGFIPDASFNVTVPTGLTNYPTLSAEGYCNDLIILSDDLGDGSLMGQSFLTVSGTTTIQRYTTAGTWHGISGPLDNDDFNSLYFNGNPDVWGKSYNESSNTYTYATDLGTDLGDAKGWMVWIDGSTAQTFDFTGDLRSTLTPIALTNTGADALHGYNFVGNPYPSAIDWDEATGWTKTNVDGGIWVWDPVAGDFAEYNVLGGNDNGSNFIPVGQGFFVQVTAGQSSGTLGMNTDIQVHNNVAFMKSPKVLPQNFIKLQLTDGDRTDESIIHLNDAATEDYDGQFDMHKMFSYSAEQPQLYSTDNSFMAINALPLGTVSVPMDVRGVDGNEMTIAIAEVTDFTEVYLSDDFTGEQTNLMENPYTFVYNAGQTDRFTIYFTVVGTDENTLENVQAYSFDQKIRVVIPMEMNAHVEVTNMLGQTVDEMDAHLGTHDINMAHGGYYLVTITGDNQRITRKVFIK